MSCALRSSISSPPFRHSGIKSITYPFNMVRVDFVHQHCVKAARGAAVAQKIVLGSAHQFLLFVRGDAYAGPAEIGIAAQANFNKYRRAAIAHDQVYLAKTAAVIGFQQD